jgi:hypothetical protein
MTTIEVTFGGAAVVVVAIVAVVVAVAHTLLPANLIVHYYWA